MWTRGERGLKSENVANVVCKWYQSVLKEGKASGKWRDNGGGGGEGGVEWRVAPILSLFGRRIIRLHMRKVTGTSSLQENHENTLSIVDKKHLIML